MHSTAGSRFSSRTSPSRPANEPPLILAGFLLAGGSVAAFQHQYRDDEIRSASMRRRMGLSFGMFVILKHEISCAAICTGTIGSVPESALYSCITFRIEPARLPFLRWSDTRTSWCPSKVDVPWTFTKCMASKGVTRMRLPLYAKQKWCSLRSAMFWFFLMSFFVAILFTIQFTFDWTRL